MDTAKAIMTSYDKIGAYLNAFTHKDHTCYHVKCADIYAANCIDVLSDIVMNSVFKEREANLEKSVVKEETIRQSDEPTDCIYKMDDELIFSGTPYAEPIDDLQYHLDKDVLPNKLVVELYKKYYTPSNMGVSIVSNLPFQTVKKMISTTHFMKRTPPTGICPPPEFLLSTPGGVQYKLLRKKGIRATHLTIGFRICNYKSPDKYPLFLLSNIIGGYMSSRLVMLLREKHGLTYISTSSVHAYMPFGQITIYTMCDHTKMMKNKKNKGVLQLVLDLLADLVKHGISQKELDSAKGNYRGKYLESMEDPATMSLYNGKEVILYDNPNPVPYADLYETFDEPITKKQMNDVLRKYFRKDNMAVCLLGENIPTLESVKNCKIDLE